MTENVKPLTFKQVHNWLGFPLNTAVITDCIGDISKTLPITHYITESVITLVSPRFMVTAE